MADWYVDHGCTLYPTAYMAAPASAASLPQEGDGKASGTGAAPAVAAASINLTGSTAAAGATISVMGATLTCVASGATAVQFNAGSGATLAANLATAINAATSAPTTTTGGISAPYLKGLVWAVAAGAVLTVHTRIASADLNQAANASCIIACGTLGSWTAAPANANFSGGVSGPWSLAFNVAALAGTVNATISGVGTYGAWIGTLMGLPAAGDRIRHRTGRAGSDIELVMPAATMTFSTRNVGSAAAYLTYEFDNGVVWNDGNSNGVFTLTKNTGSFTSTINTRGYSCFKGRMKSGVWAILGATCNFKMQALGTESASYYLAFNMLSSYGVGGTVVECLETYDAGLGAATSSLISLGITPNVFDMNRPVVLRNCKLGHVTRAAASMLNYSASYGSSYELVDCLLAFGSATTYLRALMAYALMSSPQVIRLIRPKFTGGGGGHHCLMEWLSNIAHQRLLYIEDPVDMGQFIPSDSAASACGAVAGQVLGAGGGTETGPGQIIVSNNGKREMLIDMPRFLIEWRDAGFPTTGLSTAQNGAPLSFRFNVAPSSVAVGLVSSLCPQKALRQSVVNTLGASASMLLTQHLLIDANYGGSSYTPADDEWWLEGTYISSVDGSVVPFTTKGTGSSLSSDTQAWSSLSFAPFAGASRSYSRWKITKTLTDVAAGCDVAVRLYCAKQPSTMNEWCFIDPEFVLSV